jgi:hypothetical protein
MKRNHIAYNTTTGEVLMCSTGNSLKRFVEKTNRWAKKYNYPCGKWVFSHNGNPSTKEW